MDITEIRSTIKKIIAKTTNIQPESISDTASFRDDLGLDSLATLEIGIDVDYQFKLNLPEEEMEKIRTVEDAVVLVVRRLAEKETAKETAV